MNNLSCPQCGLSHTKQNGHTHYSKQNYHCLHCGRQFVEDSQRIDQPAGVYNQAQLAAADEIFLTSAEIGVAIVTMFDFRRYTVAAASLALQMREAFRQQTRQVD